MQPQNSHTELCLVASPGGHFFELYLLQPFWEQHRRFWITFPSADTDDLLKNEEVYWYTPVNRNPLKYLKALIWCLRLLRAKRPRLLISTGANIGAVAIHAARLLGIKTVFIELTARITDLSLSCKLIYPFASVCLAQWEELSKHHPKMEYQGRVI